MQNQLNTCSIHIISRYVPIEHRAGHFTYLLEVMRYLSQSGYQLELDVLNPWCLPEDVPEYIYAIAEVFIMPSVLLRSPSNASESRIKTLLRPFYQRLPLALLHPLRHWWYRFRGQTVPGTLTPAAKATEGEIAFITNCLTRRPPDILLVNETFLGNILEICKGDRRILKAMLAFDLHHQRSEKLRQAQLHRNHFGWEWQQEAEQLKWADLIVSIQREDAKTLQQMAPHAEIVCAPMAAEYQAHPVEEQVEGRCVFVASAIEPNVNGLRWFLEEVWPEVLQTHPSASLHVCGSVCTHFQQGYQNVRFLGHIDDIVPEYGTAEVCLLPLRAGSGLKIKLVEALSHGRACVSTSVGVQGVQELADKAVLVSDTPEDFARAVITVLKNPEKRNVMQTQAKNYVIENLSPEKAYQPFIDRLDQHLRRYSLSAGNVVGRTL